MQLSITVLVAALACGAFAGRSPIDARRAGGTASAAKDGKACKTNLNQILNSGTCVNGKCQIIIPPNETSNVRSADCE
ncbi:hypothetical protein K456DRAFT_1717527 [Colletotrichum gloeosporioides 23]|nr:hypothetical protein K456DRAFT_1717527 [Colletotrichum gloeosporioides 23]